MKFNDVNGNGVRDAGEPGLSGVTIQLKFPSGPTTTTTTDASGAFSFTGLPAGTLTLSEIVPPGFTQTAPAAPGTFSVPLALGQAATGFLFGNRAGAAQTGSISGTKFTDANGNGVRDPGEAGQPGVTIQLKPAAGPTLSTTTDAAGAFSFTGLAAGTYVLGSRAGRIRPDGAAGARHDLRDASPPARSRRDSCSAISRRRRASARFPEGNSDINTNGVVDGPRPAAAGIVIVLTDSGGLVRKTTSAADGTFSFTASRRATTCSPRDPSRLCPDLPRDAGQPGTHKITRRRGRTPPASFLNKC